MRQYKVAPDICPTNAGCGGLIELGGAAIESDFLGSTNALDT
jgi:hypothetical protein